MGECSLTCTEMPPLLELPFSRAVARAERAMAAVFVLVRGVLILAWLSLGGSGVRTRPEGFGLSPHSMLLGVRNCILRIPKVGFSPGGT